MPKIACISDLHTHMQHVIVPPCDIVICAGDISYSGHTKDIKKFLQWFSAIKAQHHVFIAGNHDLIFERDPERAANILAKFPSVIYLENSGVIIDGLKLWGSPWTQKFHDWAFNADADKLQAVWSQIPDDTDILITHSPQYGILDRAQWTNELAGCKQLATAIARVKPKVHIFGHIHEGYGMVERGGVVHVNASICTVRYEPINKPILIDIDN